MSWQQSRMWHVTGCCPSHGNNTDCTCGFYMTTVQPSSLQSQQQRSKTVLSCAVLECGARRQNASFALSTALRSAWRWLMTGLPRDPKQSTVVVSKGLEAKKLQPDPPKQSSVSKVYATSARQDTFTSLCLVVATQSVISGSLSYAV